MDVAWKASLAREALDRVQAYFGDTPFPQYTVQLELLKPLPGHDYNFSQEHTDSGTFSLSVDAAITAQSTAQQQRPHAVQLSRTTWRTAGFPSAPMEPATARSPGR